MKLMASMLLIGAALAAAQPVSADEGTWEPSTLKPETLDKVHAAVQGYQGCINDQTQTHLKDKLDSRQVTDAILRACEDKLGPAKAAFDSEKVPSSISERYLRSKRSVAAQQVLRVVMATQAVRSAE